MKLWMWPAPSQEVVTSPHLTWNLGDLRIQELPFTQPWSASTTVRMKWLEIPYVRSHIVREQFRQRALALNKSTL